MGSADVGRDQAGRFRATVNRLQVAQKPGRGAPPYSRWVNRRLGRYIAAAGFMRNVTPNQMTATSAFFTLIGVVLIATIRPVWWLGPLVCLFLVLGYACDAADGQLARLYGGGSPAGEWLDHVVDATKICLLHSVVLFSLYQHSGIRSGFLLVPLGYQAVASVFFFTFILMEKLRQGLGREGHRSGSGSSGSGLLQTLVAAPTDYGVLCLTFLTIGWTQVFLPVYTAMFCLNLLVLAGALLRWWRELRASGVRG